jgi:hypothetical protein
MPDIWGRRRQNENRATCIGKLLAATAKMENASLQLKSHDILEEDPMMVV